MGFNNQTYHIICIVLHFQHDSKEGIDEVVYRKNLLEASVNIYLKKPSSILECFNRLKMLCTSQIEVHQIPGVANVSEILSKRIEINDQMSENIIEKLNEKYNECEDKIAAEIAHRTAIWLVQAAVTANSILYDQNRRNYFQQNKTLTYASSTTFPLSFQLLLQKLNQFSSWPFQHEVCFELESDQLSIHNLTMIEMMEAVSGTKITGGQMLLLNNEII